MKYIVLIETEEHGPITPDVLVKWVESGRVLPKTKVRNAILNKWHKAEDYDFLEGAFLKQRENTDDKAVVKEAASTAKKCSIDDVEGESDFYEKIENLTSYKNPFLPSPAPASLRIMATLFDFILVAVVIVCFFFLLVYSQISYGISINVAFYLFSIFSFLLFMIYYAAFFMKLQI